MVEDRPTIWLVTIGEPMPTDPGNPRLMRHGMLARALRERGCRVVFWNSTIEHSLKTFRFAGTTKVEIEPDFTAWFLHGRPFTANVSLARIFNHIDVAREFRRLARTEVRPDAIVASMPTIELAEAATLLGREWNIPSIVDFRDLWPDIWEEAFSTGWRRLLYPLAIVAMTPFRRSLRRAVDGATSRVGISDPILEWAVAKSRRPRSPDDRVFPLAYDERAPALGEEEAAGAFLDSLGLAERDDVLTACFLGTFSRRTDLSTVIGGARLAAAAGVPVRFVLAGTGETEAEVRALADGLPNVVFTGWIDAPKIHVLMRRSSVGLLPYRNTTDFLRSLPNKSIEYLSAGLPIVSPLGGMVGNLVRERDCGLAYGEGDAAALASGLAALASNPARLGHLRAHARAAFDGFGANAVYGAYADFILQLARRRA